MDSKVLESLMIPEYEIATEGLGETIKNGFRKICGLILTAINTIIGLIKACVSKLKSKKPVKVSEPVKDDKGEKEKQTKRIIGTQFVSDTTAFQMKIGIILSDCDLVSRNLFMYIRGMKSEDQLTEKLDSVSDYIENFSNAFRNYKAKYNTSSKIYLFDSDKERLVKELNKDIQQFEETRDSVAKKLEQVDTTSGSNGAQAMNRVMTEINKSVSTGVIACKYIINVINSVIIIDKEGNEI